MEYALEEVLISLAQLISGMKQDRKNETKRDG